MGNEMNDNFFREALNHTNVGLIITDPNQSNHPIIFVNRGFTKLTGYEESEVLGKNCRFLQGDSSDTEAKEKINEAIENETSVSVEIYNYKKNGEGFWNELTIDPMWVDDQLYFVGVQNDITRLKEKRARLEETMEQLKQLSTPIVPIDDNISALPLIGSITDERFNHLTEAISEHLIETKSDYLILDLSGLFEIEQSMAASILKLNDLTQLVGTQLIITGVRPSLALMTRDLTDNISHLRTYLTLQDAIKALS